jgi:hypothetical protein
LASWFTAVQKFTISSGRNTALAAMRGLRYGKSNHHTTILRYGLNSLIVLNCFSELLFCDPDKFTLVWAPAPANNIPNNQKDNTGKEIT